MGKLAAKPVSRERARITRLQAERRKLASKLQQLDAELAKLNPRRSVSRAATLAELEQWFDELAQGIPAVPSLPADFSRADLYEDHD